MTQEFERDLNGLERNIQRGWKGILLWIGALQTRIKLTLNQLKTQAHAYKQFYMDALIY